jgi:hypothetical protein
VRVFGIIVLKACGTLSRSLSSCSSRESVWSGVVPDS